MLTTAMISIDALRCDWNTYSISIIGPKYKSNGLKKPSQDSPNLSLLSVRYVAKNTTNATFANSDGWKVMLVGLSIIHLVAPPC